jgi:MFS transporter, FSR family, fosmidomycin resistance protein
MLSTLMLLSGAGGSLVGGQVGDRGDRTVIILISSASTAALIAVLLGIPLPTLPLVLLLILTGFSHSLARPCLNALTSGAAPAGKMGSVFGLVFGVMSLGGSISTPLVGYMADRHSIEMGIALITCFFLAFGLLIFGFRRMIDARAG